MENPKNILESMYSKLDNFLKTETVVGEPITIDSVKLIPIITASFGLGGGFGEDENKNAGGGGGLGCKLTADAILVIKDNNVELIPVKKKGSLDKLIEKVPELVGKLEKLQSKEKKEKEEENIQE
ncbi:MAG: sporulation protein [Halanaerobiales bacterium]|nr:sporulation protein [Halanaerobiales bacterium]